MITYCIVDKCAAQQRCAFMLTHNAAGAVVALTVVANVFCRILFQGSAVSCSQRINPGKPLVCCTINPIVVQHCQRAHMHTFRLQQHQRKEMAAKLVLKRRFQLFCAL